MYTRVNNPTIFRTAQLTVQKGVVKSGLQTQCDEFVRPNVYAIHKISFRKKRFTIVLLLLCLQFLQKNTVQEYIEPAQNTE